MRLNNDTPCAFAWTVASFRRRELTACFVVKLTCRLEHETVCAPLPEGRAICGAEHWDDDPAASLRCDDDLLPFKPQADLLLVGDCHAADGKPTTTCLTRFAVGDWEKRLAVIGDRVWQDGWLGKKMGEPQAFSRMSVRYERAFGGPDDAHNPVGRGRARLLLPNIEYPDQLIHSPRQQVPVAGYGPLRRDWRPRCDRLGTYDKTWLRERFPWPPADFDWTTCNAAPLDQRVDYLQGDETIACDFLHPSWSHLRCQLPGLRPRCIVAFQGQEELQEAPLVCDTLLVDTTAEEVVLTWRGRLPVADLALKDIDAIHLAVEELKEPPQPLESFRAALQEAEEVDTDEPPVAEEEPPSADAAWAMQIPRDWAAQLAADLAAGEAEALAQEADMLAKMPPQPATPSSPPVDLPASVRLRQMADALHGTAAAEAPRPGLPSTIDRILADATSCERAEAELAQMRLALDHLQASQPDAAAETPWTRERLIEALAAQTTITEVFFEDLDLSALDGAGARLDGVVFKNCRLSRSRWTGASWTRTQCIDCQLDGVDATELQAPECALIACDLTASDWTGAVLDGASWDACQGAAVALRRIQARRASFAACQLAELDAREAAMQEADFSDAVCPSADFRGADCRQTAFTGAEITDADFRGADCRQLQGRDGADFSRTDFRRVVAAEATFFAANLGAADFSGADCREVDFTDADLRQARFLSSILRQARFVGSDLRGACLIAADGYQGQWIGADCRGADCTGLNGYALNAMDARLAETRFDDAILTRAYRGGSDG